ncbi:MAG TPA: LLM class F420-dependent oxidoreductase [Ilumatobacteraceae bacterium]|nr:LLM class F420-dependent oxidoreductase [Ilumatobacteraceae bacterium]
MRLSDLCIFTEPQQGATYDDLLAVATRAEQLGFGGFFRSDHFLKMGSVSGLPGPTDAWVTLAGLARDTSTIRLGTLVSPVTFRSPGLLAVSVAQVDQMSGGRVELGIGAGWYEAEHTAYAFDFGSPGSRIDRLEDQLAIMTGMWNTAEGEKFNFAGKVFSVTDSPGLPKPVQRPLPIIMGGSGPKRTPALAARYADEFNVSFKPLETFIEQKERVTAACAAASRTRPMRYSAALVVCAGKDEAEVERRAGAIGRSPAQLREDGAAGSAEETAATIRRYVDAGAQRIYLQVLDLADLDHLDFIASGVAPLLD